MGHRILIPDLNGNIAPCFEVASKFELIILERDKVISRKKIACSGEGGFRRIRLIQLNDIDTLICSGIGVFYRDLLYTMNIELMSDVSMELDEALEGYLEGWIKPDKYRPDINARSHTVALSELVSWTRTVFENHGFAVSSGPGQDSFLIDLVAEMACPVCGKAIRAAICCGAHTYRVDQEIREFHFCAKNDYNARVYVCPCNETAAERCREYNIDYLNFDPVKIAVPIPTGRGVPILNRPIAGHEKLNLISDIK